MRLHAGVAPRREAAPCRALVGGYGSPGCRDLDFGERFIRLAEALDWPTGVVVEDLSYSAHLVLHRLQELRPAKLILVGAVVTGLDPPGTVRRYVVDGAPPDSTTVHADLTDSLGGWVGLDSMLSVVRHFGGLPADTIVLEVEAADASFGLGFSDELAAAIDPLLDVVREELADVTRAPQVESALASALGRPSASFPASAAPGRGPGGATVGAPPGIEQLFEYARAHARVRALTAAREELPTFPGVTMAARFLAAGSGLGMSGDWYEVLPVRDGVVGVVAADVAGAERLQVAAVTAQLRAAFHALALVEGDRPARVIGRLGDLAGVIEAGEGSTMVYLTVDPRRAAIRAASAGHCPPLLLGPDGRASFLDLGASAPLGKGGGTGAARVVGIEPGSTLLVFTDGLVSAPGGTVDDGLRRLRLAAESGPRSLDELCDHVLEWCTAAHSPDFEDDVTLIALRTDD